MRDNYRLLLGGRLFPQSGWKSIHRDWEWPILNPALESRNFPPAITHKTPLLIHEQPLLLSSCIISSIIISSLISKLML